VLVYHLLGFPTASQFLFISYETSPNKYDKGVGDAYFVVFWTIMFTFLRASFIKFGYLPLAGYFNIGEASKRQRVAEQLYILAYYVVFGAAGLVSVVVLIDNFSCKKKGSNYIIWRVAHYVQ
jgi:hypothetical protein